LNFFIKNPSQKIVINFLRAFYNIKKARTVVFKQPARFDFKTRFQGGDDTLKFSYILSSTKQVSIHKIFLLIFTFKAGFFATLSLGQVLHTLVETCAFFGFKEQIKQYRTEQFD